MDNSKTRLVLAVITVVAVVAGAFFVTGYFRDRNVEGDSSLSDLDTAELADLLASGKPGIVELYTTACPWCTKLEPELAKVKAEYDGKLFVAKMNAQKHTAEAARYQVRVVPTMVFFNEAGLMESTVEGFMEAPDILALIQDMGIVR